MATNRDSDIMRVEFRISSNFDWMNEGDFAALRGGSTVTRTVDWAQGDPEISSFDINDISILYFSDSAGNNAINSADSDWNIGNQTIAQIITLTNFVDNSDSTGSVDVQVNPSGIDSSELTALRNVYIRLRVSQPDPGE